MMRRPSREDDVHPGLDGSPARNAESDPLGAG